MQSTNKVDDVAMLASGEVVPLIAFCVHFEGRCVLLPQWRAVPIGIALDLFGFVSSLLEVVHDRSLLDLLYRFHVFFSWRVIVGSWSVGRNL